MILAKKEYTVIRKKDDAAQNYYFQSKGEALPPPVLSLSVNNNCYMRCKMCDIGASNAKRITDIEQAHMSQRYIKDKLYKEFPLDRAKGLVDEMAPYDTIIRTNFIEPLLYSHLEELVEYVKSKGLRFYTITNGWRLPRFAAWAVEANVDLLRVSLDGIQEVHDDIRGIKGSFSHSIEGLKILVEQKKRLGAERPILGVCYTISDHNYWNIVDFMQILDKEGLLEHLYVNFSHLQYASQWETAQTIASNPELFKDLKACSTVGVDPANIDVAVLAQQLDTLEKLYPPERHHYYFDPALKGQNLLDYYDSDTWMSKDKPCFLPWYITQIDISGEVTVRGHCGLPSFGNIMEQGFMDAWNSDKAKSLRNYIKENGTFPICNKCIGTLYELRGRGCKPTAPAQHVPQSSTGEMQQCAS